MEVTKKNKPYIIAGILIGVSAIIYFITKGKGELPAQIETSAPDQTIPISPKINKNLVLKKGSKGLEVQELQKLLSVKADGIFGGITEARLYKLKGVKQVSLNQYKTLQNLNQNVLPIGTKLMAIKKPGIIAYYAKERADGVFYVENYNTGYNYNYGEFVGTIVGVNGGGNYYLTTYVGVLGESPTKKQFVRASEVQKIN